MIASTELVKEKEEAIAEGVATFVCEFPEENGCQTGQYLMKDSRLCVSDYFGRNKARTTNIANQIRW